MQGPLAPSYTKKEHQGKWYDDKHLCMRCSRNNPQLDIFHQICLLIVHTAHTDGSSSFSASASASKPVPQFKISGAATTHVQSSAVEKII